MPYGARRRIDLAAIDAGFPEEGSLSESYCKEQQF
jgi:hypothetical protein